MIRVSMYEQHPLVRPVMSSTSLNAKRATSSTLVRLKRLYIFVLMVIAMTSNTWELTNQWQHISTALAIPSSILQSWYWNVWEVQIQICVRNERAIGSTRSINHNSLSCIFFALCIFAPLHFVDIHFFVFLFSHCFILIAFLLSLHTTELFCWLLT